MGTTRPTHSPTLRSATRKRRRRTPPSSESSPRKVSIWSARLTTSLPRGSTRDLHKSLLQSSRLCLFFSSAFHQIVVTRFYLALLNELSLTLSHCAKDAFDINVFDSAL